MGAFLIPSGRSFHKAGSHHREFAGRGSCRFYLLQVAAFRNWVQSSQWNIAGEMVLQEADPVLWIQLIFLTSEKRSNVAPLTTRSAVFGIMRPAWTEGTWNKSYHKEKKWPRLSRKAGWIKPNIYYFAPQCFVAWPMHKYALSSCYCWLCM